MPAISWFAYCFPNRRTDKTVVEITLDFKPADRHGFPRRASDVKNILVSSGILTADEVFPQQALPDDRMGWYTSLLVQTALLFQRKTGHRVSFHSFSLFPDQNRSIALLEHEHCDVGMTAVKLAVELLNGKRRLLAEPFRLFEEFARERLLPLETGAIIKAARRRDIPCIHLERQPYKREEFDQLTGGRCISRNGLLMLGHGVHQHVLDGTFCLDKSEDFKDLPGNRGQTPANMKNTGSGFTESTADALMDWLFPEKNSVRMPIIAVTGTNGKTTTVRMINHILSTAGRKPGMVCTDGVFLNGRQVSQGDQCTDTGHLKVLTSKAVNEAVLETHQAGILGRGFAFDWCDIAVCLNVTEDHLGEAHIDTVEQMAKVKQALVERARHAAVLNADDPHCLAMRGAMNAEQICLVSMRYSVDELHAMVGERPACFCVLELVEDEEWLVIYDQGRRLPVIKAASIPATFAGTARFNISNAMHAIVAAYLSGTGAEMIRTAMRKFHASYESTPGRLNVFHDLPFLVILDFAHNPAGLHSLCDFIDRQTVPGRKIVAFTGMVDRMDATLKNMATSLAGHFDFYFCKERYEVQPRSVAHILQQGLLGSGVSADRIAVRAFGKKVIGEIFDACEPGDLLVMLLGHDEKRRLSDYIREYAETGYLQVAGTK